MVGGVDQRTAVAHWAILGREARRAFRGRQNVRPTGCVIIAPRPPNRYFFTDRPSFRSTLATLPSSRPVAALR